MLMPFKCKIFGNDIKKINLKKLKKLNLKMKPKSFIFAKSDIIIIATDLNDTTRHLINTKTSKLIKNKPLLVNIARGPIVNEKLLVSLLKKIITGACLDVFENEPINIHSKITKFKNVILTSHNAFNTTEEVNKVHVNTYKNLVLGLKNEKFKKKLKIYENKKILITGHTGFKGSWLSFWLYSLGAKIYGISNGIPTKPSFFKACNVHKISKSFYFDLNNRQRVKKIIHKIKPDFIFHLAAQSLVSKSYSDPDITWETNLVGTKNVLEALLSYKKVALSLLLQVISVTKISKLIDLIVNQIF